MSQKNSAFVLLSLFNTLLLVSGISIVFWSAEYQICCPDFCYAIRDFTNFYEIIFFSYGTTLSMFTIFGFMAMFMESENMLRSFVKMLILLLVTLVLILWLGLWGTGPIHLRTVLLKAFQSYGTGSCRLNLAIHEIQSQFHCCGVDKIDWNLTTSLPTSCCSPELQYATNEGLKCISPYKSGCYTFLHRYIWRIISVITAIGFGLAFIITLTIIPLMKLIDILTEEKVLEAQIRLNSAFQAPQTFNLYQDGAGLKSTVSSTVV